ncbi:MAG: DegT/DnrJ/EryC1/StrS family aminotransferase [Candidatus Omnitrophica bacterium]|nr:DegT/DnrJ/EryC1/StrS family aminotransferase [Candidatus Omnitrophota bacterium]
MCSSLIKIPHSKPTISSSDKAAVANVVKTGHLAQGGKVLEFEQKVGEYLGVKNAAALNSGTSALHLALLALGVGPRDEVILPSYVCSAPLNAIYYTQATPRIVDVNPEDFNISVSEVRKKINKKTKALIVPHMFGCPADIKELVRLGVPVIEDCAQSFGAEYQGKRVGSWGTLTVCSFYATKVLTTGEGGMVLSPHLKLIDKIRQWRCYDKVDSYQVRYNYKMTEMQAALGLSQLSHLAGFLQKRRAIARAYRESLRGTSFIPPFETKDRMSIYFRFIIKVQKGKKELLEKFKDRGIEALPPVFKPLHRYVSQTQCPVADKLMKDCLSIPIYPGLTGPQIASITECLFFTSSAIHKITGHNH